MSKIRTRNVCVSIIGILVVAFLALGQSGSGCEDEYRAEFDRGVTDGFLWSDVYFADGFVDMGIYRAAFNSHFGLSVIETGYEMGLDTVREWWINCWSENRDNMAYDFEARFDFPMPNYGDGGGYEPKTGPGGLIIGP